MTASARERRRDRPKRLLAAGRLLSTVVVLLTPLPATTAVERPLPTEECVLQLREARIAGLRRNLDQQRALLEQAVERFPNEPEAQMALIQFHREHQAIPGLASQAWKRLSDTLSNSSVSLPAGVIRRFVKDPERSTEDLRLMHEAIERWLAERSNDVPLLKLKAELEARLGLLEDARATLARVLSLAPSADVRFACIRLDMKLERWESALGLIEQELALEDDSATRLQKYVLLAKLGRYDELTRELLPLLDDKFIVSNYGSVLIDAAFALHDGGQHSQAEQVFRKLASTLPEHPDLQEILSSLFSTDEERMARQTEQQERWDQETDPMLLLTEASTRLAGGDAEGAIGLLERSVLGMPDSLSAWFNLGLAAIKLEDFDRAESALSAALRVDPEFASALYNRGVVRVQLKRFAEARVDLERAAALDESNENAHYYLYVCYRQLGDQQKANAARKRYEAASD